MDLSWQTENFLKNQQTLPIELVSVLQNGTNHDFLAGLSSAALEPRLTQQIFTYYKQLALELCVRWTNRYHVSVIAACGRLVASFPHLSEAAKHIFQLFPSENDVLSVAIGSHGLQHPPQDGNTLEMLREGLLGIYRLLEADNSGFAGFIKPAKLQLLLHHVDRSIRYLAVRILCQYIHASDATMEEMITKYLGSDSVLGTWEGQEIDYLFLTLWEQKRNSDFKSSLSSFDVISTPVEQASRGSRVIQQADLSPPILEISNVLLLRSAGMKRVSVNDSAFVTTPTITSSLKRLAEALLTTEPVLVTGLASSGKSTLVKHLAQCLNKSDSMLTLHLNEQSDAKLLIGIYSTGSQPGSFEWKPGVLTNAVKQGRWLFIEDLDCAPNEILSVLIPLMERRELSIHSRGEKIQAAQGFRIIATMRSILNVQGKEIVPISRMLGQRLWKHVPLQTPNAREIADIITSRHPLLGQYVPRAMAVYDRLLHETKHASLSMKATSALRIRSTSLREFFRWCDRLDDRFRSAGMSSGHGEISETVIDALFLDAVDCFVGSLEAGPLRQALTSVIAEELHIAPQRNDYLLRDRSPRTKLSKSNVKGTYVVGRATIPRSSSTASSANSDRAKQAAPFALNGYSLRLLEQVAVAVHYKEPLLLVGETGIGKTAAIQHLAHLTGQNLLAINLSQQSESSDLLGGFKPVNVRNIIVPLKDEFDTLFELTFPTNKGNQRFSEILSKSIAKRHWKRVVVLWKEALKMADKLLNEAQVEALDSSQSTQDHITRKRKIPSLDAHDRKRWAQFADKVLSLESRLAGSSDVSIFAFTEGKLVKAVRDGHWVLLDEINLATSDTLECLAELLESGPDARPSILLAESGNIERIYAHPSFRIFAAMNPATDVGKKDLPLGIRSRFTEIYVNSPDTDAQSLQSIVQLYLDRTGTSGSDKRLARMVTELYQDIQRTVNEAGLVDGSGQRPHYSLRTLTRALAHAVSTAPRCSLRRALFEGFSMCFFTFLDNASEEKLREVVSSKLFPSQTAAKAELQKPLRQPVDSRSYILVDLDIEAVPNGHQKVKAASQKGRGSSQTVKEEHWISKGQGLVDRPSQYIITPYIARNLRNLIRAASTGKHPILIQGPTSAGKTSMIEYLAKRSGNCFVRINNHEHTDLQEYLGTYVSTNDGQLVFQEGVLVQAVRAGHWVVLDELNLAPTDVLEALNRLLDDNRELLIAETQEIIRPHPNFMLFATQNPVGPYGGRKTLSRAFRNRFLELHFDDIPVQELNVIISRRSQLPEPWCGLIVEVYKRLAQVRQEQRLFEQHSFATLRDLFRWAFRGADTVEELADNGYMLLAEKVRKPEDKITVRIVIEQVMTRKGVTVHINDSILYSESHHAELATPMQTVQDKIVWTKAMRRLFILVVLAIRNNEPVLLVGETGCGKTTICQILAEVMRQQLYIVNAHQNTETSDLIGAQRPVRGRAAIEQALLDDLNTALGISRQEAYIEIDDMLKHFDSIGAERLRNIPAETKQRIQINRGRRKALFEWSDGSLVSAMRNGQFYLLDEISLADDSVLERLNSVLDPQRTILIAEKGAHDSLVVAKEGFQFFATMNPGGDFGKKELSPALRNRFTEIWVPPMTDLVDVLQIVSEKLKPSAISVAQVLVKFATWFNERFTNLKTSTISIRDMLAWVSFINAQETNLIAAVVNGAALVYIDTLGANPAAILAVSTASVAHERQICLNTLSELLGHDVYEIYHREVGLTITETQVLIGQFSIDRISNSDPAASFNFAAPTTRINAMRIARALQLSKPVLLEGSPGVGKTSIIIALSKVTGQPLTRMNLSEQTDLMDLFGSDVPVDDGDACQFGWRDAPFLTAMKRGEWVLLDEMNLASQSVLEGLNACLDHRGEVYIAELGQVFSKHPDFRLFAAQNPHHQGGGRKGLPASFVNRFTIVYADLFQQEDLHTISTNLFPAIEKDLVENVVKFVTQLNSQVTDKHLFGARGSPWEFNLRDVLRLLQMLSSKERLFPAANVRDFLEVLFMQRFRTARDTEKVLDLFNETFQKQFRRRDCYFNVTATTVQAGIGMLKRRQPLQSIEVARDQSFLSRLPLLESLFICVQQSWPVLLVGGSGSGKSHLLHSLASLVGINIVTFSLNADVDAADLVGGYEQSDPLRQIGLLIDDTENCLKETVAKILSSSYDKHSTDINAPLLGFLAFLQDKSRLDISIYELKDRLLQLSELVPSTEILLLLDRCGTLINNAHGLQSAKFEWIDGTLVEALEKGQWLILDNANLCSSSVLDRLNSLLEPNGSLIISEHSLDDGTPRIVRPHPNFRIFMTMDPQYGEVSRAMRNRAVELFVEHLELFTMSQFITLPLSLEARMARFQQVVQICNQNDHDGLHQHVVDAAFELLSFSDLERVPSFVLQAAKGLVPYAYEETLSAMVSKFASSGRINDAWRIASIDYYEKALPIELSCSVDTYHDQSIQALVNQPLVALSVANSVFPDPYWLSNMFEVTLDVTKMDQSLATVKDTTREVRAMSRLERSFNAGRIPRAEIDSTYRIASFLSNLMATILEWSKNVSLSSENDWDAVRFVTAIRHFWWNLFRLTSSTDFHEAAFQVYLSMGATIISSASSLTSHESTIATRIAQQFDRIRAAAQLKTGLNMERIWKICRPVTVPDLHRLELLSQVEHLADRFDGSVWKIKATPQDLFSVYQSISSSMSMIRHGNVVVGSLVENLEALMNQLTGGKPVSEVNVTPFFVTVFEGLCQYHDFVDQGSRDMQCRLGFFASRSSKRAYNTSQWSRSARSLNMIVNYCGPLPEMSGPTALKGNLPVATIEHLSHVKETTLKQLDLLQHETQILGAGFALSESNICSDQSQLVLKVVSEVAVEIVNKHSVSLNSQFNIDTVRSVSEIDDYINNISSITGRPEDAQLCRVIQEQFGPLLRLKCLAQDLHVDRKQLGFALVAFAIGCLMLYVPDKPFDPALKAQIEKTSHDQRLKDLYARLEALSIVERCTTGQELNLRYDIVKREADELGTAPLAPPVARPVETQVDELQAEFSNILRLVERIPTESQNASFAAENIVMSISRLIQRLQGSFRVYEDITMPLIGFLSCLKLGLRLTPSQSTLSAVDSDSCVQLDDIPFMHMKSALKPTLHESPLRGKNVSTKTYIHLLKTCVFLSSIEQITLWTTSYQSTFLTAMDTIYAQWKLQVAKGQRQVAEASSIYHYRGSAEAEDEADEEEYNSLFPTFDDTDEDARPLNERTSKTDIQDYAPTIAKLHANILASKSQPADELESMLRCTAQLRGERVSIDTYSSQEDCAQDLFPATLLLLHDFQHKIKFDDKLPSNYNVYTDVNISEAQRLVRLVDEVQTCFEPVAEAWPEHATLQTISSLCEELLAFRYVDPVMKFLTKAEKLHEAIREWQSVASREYSRPDAFNRLTDIIISWRQLELSTWARLLDLEAERCEDQAISWWFIGYESVVVGSQSMASSPELLLEHTNELISTLEVFMRNSTVGQFEPRLRMLGSLVSQLELQETITPLLQPVRFALSSFLQHFSRFTFVVMEAVTKGRIKLEKEIKNVIQLASWKDRNINILKQSAKASHRKLFRVIRKFRALLAQPVASILDQDLPSHHTVGGDEQTSVHTEAEIVITDSTLTACKANEITWTGRPERFRHVASTISMMRLKYSTGASHSNGHHRLTRFIEDLQASISHLQKATPATLNEANAPFIKRLTTQKRQLFASTLKEIREMGMKSNISADVLSSQASLASVLCKNPLLAFKNDEQVLVVQDDLHKILDIMPRVRGSSTEHSEELNQAEVVRSVGYAESFLQLCLKQRRNLAQAFSVLKSLKSYINQVANLWSNEACCAAPEVSGSTVTIDYVKEQLNWLPPVIEIGIKLFKVQTELTGLELTPLLQNLGTWLESFKDLHAKSYHLPDMPPGLVNVAHIDLIVEYEGITKDFTEFLHGHLPQATHGKLILQHIIAWLTRYPSPRQMPPKSEVVDNNSGFQVQQIIKQHYDMLDLVLGSVQDVSNAKQKLAELDNETAWLTKEDSLHVSLLGAFHPETIATAIGRSTDLLQILAFNSSTDLQLACASLTLTLPILQQYLCAFIETTRSYANFHAATCEVTYKLAKSLNIIASQGFCKPVEKSGEKANASEKLESGTGLGEGEGAEDISKEIGADEDMTDLAQDEDLTTQEKDIQKAQDAVDIEDEMEGGRGADTENVQDEDGEQDDGASKSGEEGEGGSTGGGDVGEEAEDEGPTGEDMGSVDDLGPSAVDEKLWDQAGDDDAKEKEGQQDSKAASKDERTDAGTEQSVQKEKKDGDAGEADKEEVDQGDDESEMNEEMSDFGSEAGSANQTDVMDAHMKETEGLELPDDLQLDGDKAEHDDGLSEDLDMEQLDSLDEDDQAKPAAEEEEASRPDAVQEELDEGDAVETEPLAADEERNGDDASTNNDADEENQAQAQAGRDGADNQGAMEMDTQPGGAEPDDQSLDKNEQQSANAEQMPPPQQDLNDDDPKPSAASVQRASGTTSDAAKESQPASAANDTQPQDRSFNESKDTNTIRKLGSVLEQWHRQQHDIREYASEQREDKNMGKEERPDISLADAEFEHLPDEDAQEDTQALGASTAEQARALDESMAVDNEKQTGEQDFLLENEVSEQEDEANAMDLDVDEETNTATRNEDSTSAQQQQPQSFVSTQRLLSRDQADDMHSPPSPSPSLESVLDPIEDHLSTMQLDHEPDLVAAAAQRWAHHESRTHTLALLLTEQLRLILAPTRATRLRGDFRTGKRLNMKRVIPYIASQYKRDKIWLRRSQPSKRAYQILLALDDSRSMIEDMSSSSTSWGSFNTANKNTITTSKSLPPIETPTAANLAFDTLALLSRALSTLESGDLGVLAFGSDVTIAHPLGTPFLGNDAGSNTLRHFTFAQHRTDVARLIRRSIEIFREARARGAVSGGGGTAGQELWQLELVVSDGICEDHEGIRRLLVEALEERIMVVFIIVDAAAGGGGNGKQGTGQSILDLERVEFVQAAAGDGEGNGDGFGGDRIVRRKYLETFPFGYYLVVKDVRELPGVLATALRQWFAEVAER